MSGSKLVDTVMDDNEKLSNDNGNDPPVNKCQYQRLVGILIYLSHTILDLAFSVSCASQFMHAPSKSHLDAIYQILKYLKGTPGRGLFFKRNESQSVEVYVDAD